MDISNCNVIYIGLKESRSLSSVKCKNFKFHRINKLINSYNKYNYCAKNAHKKCYQGAGAELED